MGFDAGSAVARLDYDFSTTPVADEETRKLLVEAKGTIPEPSQDTLERFEQAQLDAMKSTGLDLTKIAQIASLGEDASEAEVAAVVGSMTEEEVERAMAASQDAHAALVEAAIAVCQGTPSEEQIRALPPRVQQAFVGWLTGELTRPTRPTSGSTRSLAVANGAGPHTG